MIVNVLSLFALLPLTTAHFTLTWPTKRGFDDAKATDGPCGGFDSVSSSRTEFPLSGGPVQLDLGHTQTRIAVYLALGDEPTSFNITLVPQLSEEGPKNFCLGSVNIPSNLNISSGTNGTIQVVTNGHSGGGLYQCADVTFVDSISESDYSDNCQNSTGVRVVQENMSGNPNDTTPSPSAGGDDTSPSPTPGAATHATAGSWVLGAVGMAAYALL